MKNSNIIKHLNYYNSNLQQNNFGNTFNYIVFKKKKINYQKQMLLNTYFVI